MKRQRALLEYALGGLRRRAGKHVAMTVGLAFVVGMVFWKALGAVMGVRVSAEDELEGLDRSECGVDAYGVELTGVSTASEAHSGAALAAQEA